VVDSRDPRRGLGTGSATAYDRIDRIGGGTDCPILSAAPIHQVKADANGYFTLETPSDTPVSFTVVYCANGYAHATKYGNQNTDDGGLAPNFIRLSFIQQ
jgi:hypothetical protein